ncbi:MAG: ABC transporter permease [Spirochaetota bacterium]
MRMPVVFKIALRNVRQHKSKTAIIGVLITLGVGALVIGNSIMDTAESGIREAYLRTFTGDLVVAGESAGFVSFLGAQEGADQGLPPTIDQYTRVRDYLLEHELVQAISPQVHGNAIISVDEEMAGFGFIFGIQPERYRETFPDNMEIVEGRFLDSGETGMLLNAAAREDLEQSSGVEIEIGDELILTGTTRSAGTRIRSVPIVGIFRFLTTNAQLDNTSLVDGQTIRALNAMNVSPVEAVELSESQRRLLEDFDEDDLFGGGITDDGDFGATAASDGGTGSREDELLNIFGDLPERPAEGDNATAWHFILVRLSDQRAYDALAADLWAFFQEEEIGAQIIDWQQAAGPSANLVRGIQIALNTAIFLVVVVAVIIIMNTLVISVTERIPEIGTMRAIGAHRSFVRRMVLSETAILSVFFGLIGVLFGMAVLGVLSLIGLEATNQFLRLIYGGDVLRPVLSISAVLSSLVGVVVAGLVASLYPTRVALQIRPVVAMQGK